MFTAREMLTRRKSVVLTDWPSGYKVMYISSCTCGPLMGGWSFWLLEIQFLWWKTATILYYLSTPWGEGACQFLLTHRTRPLRGLGIHLRANSRSCIEWNNIISALGDSEYVRQPKSVDIIITWTVASNEEATSHDNAPTPTAATRQIATNAGRSDTSMSEHSPSMLTWIFWRS